MRMRIKDRSFQTQRIMAPFTPYAIPDVLLRKAYGSKLQNFTVFLDCNPVFEEVTSFLKYDNSAVYSVAINANSFGFFSKSLFDLFTYSFHYKYWPIMNKIYCFQGPMPI